MFKVKIKQLSRASDHEGGTCRKAPCNFPWGEHPTGSERSLHRLEVGASANRRLCAHSGVTWRKSAGHRVYGEWKVKITGGMGRWGDTGFLSELGTLETFDQRRDTVHNNSDEMLITEKG